MEETTNLSSDIEKFELINGTEIILIHKSNEILEKKRLGELNFAVIIHNPETFIKEGAIKLAYFVQKINHNEYVVIKSFTTRKMDDFNKIVLDLARLFRAEIIHVDK